MIKQKNKRKTLQSKDKIDQLIFAELLVENYRFSKYYLAMINKADLSEKKKYESAYSFHENKILDLAKNANLNIVTFNNADYDEGLPVTPLNADEFNPTDNLIIQQTIEPTILDVDGNIIKQGTVILGIKYLEENN